MSKPVVDEYDEFTDGRAISTMRLLFVAEAVTLAHVARPFTLARLLAGDSTHTMIVACDRRAHGMLAGFPGEVHHLSSQSSEHFADALDRGRPVFSLETLRDYLRDDLRLFKNSRPDVIIGDFRISLAASARIAGIPYIAISNSYWSPFHRGLYPVPDLPALTRWLPIPLAQLLFDVARPVAFALHARPMELLLREHGLPSLGHDLRRAYSEADYTLYADISETACLTTLPETHRYLGALIWDPPCPLPDWWADVASRNRPLVYLSLGSSGKYGILDELLHTLATLDVTVMLSTAGRVALARVPANVFVADYLPGSIAAARAHVVIGNGGSPITQQALTSGRPVIGICRNLDQYLNMTSIERSGAGIMLRADRITADAIHRAVQRCLHSETMQERARTLQRAYGAVNARHVLTSTLREIETAH